MMLSTSSKDFGYRLRTATGNTEADRRRIISWVLDLPGMLSPAI